MFNVTKQPAKFPLALMARCWHAATIMLMRSLRYAHSFVNWMKSQKKTFYGLQSSDSLFLFI